MLAQQSLVLLLLIGIVLFLHHGEAWRSRRRRRAPPPCHAHDCKISGWSHWSECSHRCGSAATQYRTRWKTGDETCGGACPFDFRDQRGCNRYACYNGGTPSYARCSCRTGFSGTCCEQVAENRNTANPSQSKTTKDVGIPVGCSAGGFCLAMILGLIFRYYKKKNQAVDIAPPNRQQDNTPPNLQVFYVSGPPSSGSGNVFLAGWQATGIGAAESRKTTGQEDAPPGYSYHNNCPKDLPPVYV